MIKNKKVFRIDESEKERILGMHIQATQSQYLTEQSVDSVEGTLMDAVDGYMMSSMIKDFKTPGKVYTIGNISGNVQVPNKKMLKSTDKIVFNGEGEIVAYPQDDMDAQFLIKPNKGKLTVYRGS